MFYTCVSSILPKVFSLFELNFFNFKSFTLFFFPMLQMFKIFSNKNFSYLREIRWTHWIWLFIVVCCEAEFCGVCCASCISFICETRLFCFLLEFYCRAQIKMKQFLVSTWLVFCSFISSFQYNVMCLENIA